MSGILRLESLTKGNTLKQGDKTPLKYKLLDADGDLLSITGKSAEVRLVYPDFLTIGYKKDGLTVAQDDTVTFTIDQAIPARIYHVEIIVDNKFVFPSRAHETKLTVDKSSLGADANIIEIVGKDVLIQSVKSQVDTELQPLVTSLESAQQAEAQRASEESSRASAEAQRAIDHANRSAELDGKADKVVIKNLPTLPLTLPYNEDFEGNTSDVWYVYVEARYTQYNSGRTRLSLRNYRTSVNVTDVTFENRVSENFESYSLRAGGKVNGIRLIISSDLSPDLEVDIKNLIALNLTETFGAGNEPTKEEMDELIKVIGYIDGEYALNNKEMLIWTLGLIRYNTRNR